MNESTHKTSADRWWDSADTDPVHLEAVEWFTRLEDPEVSLEDTLAWQDWIKADPRHAHAFNRIEEISNAMRFVRTPPRQSAWALARDRYDGSVPLRQWRSPRRPNFALAASLVLGAALFAWLALKGDDGAQTWMTDVGEHRTIALEDGSKVVLGGASRLEVKYTDHARSLELQRGEALFTVAPDTARPFRVLAGKTSVLAVGTEFNVRRGSNRVVVAVTQGRVLVEPEPHAAPLPLNAGQQTTVDAQGAGSALPLNDPAAATSWQIGRLAFRLQPLAYVLEDVNRYAKKPVVLEDKVIGDLLITGTVDARNIEEWIGSLERGFQLRAEEEARRIVLRRAGQTGQPPAVF